MPSPCWLLSVSGMLEALAGRCWSELASAPLAAAMSPHALLLLAAALARRIAWRIAAGCVKQDLQHGAAACARCGTYCGTLQHGGPALSHAACAWSMCRRGGVGIMLLYSCRMGQINHAFGA